MNSFDDVISILVVDVQINFVLKLKFHSNVPLKLFIISYRGRTRVAF